MNPPDKLTAIADLAQAVQTALAYAQTCLKISKDPHDIKQSTEALRGFLAVWTDQTQVVTDALRGFLAMSRKYCKHPNAQRGYNERDGSWMNPCPDCGHSE